MAHYKFKTKWVFDASSGTTVDQVWDALRSHEYEQWWEGVTAKVLEQGDANGLGELRESFFKTRLPYTLSFQNRLIALQKPDLIQLEAYGELEGTGTYHITKADKLIEVIYLWDVVTTKRWMNIMAPIMKPMFKWNHDQVMKRGADGLAKHLNIKLVHG
ncbi:MAG: hypothetical protein ACO1OT_16620 [Heyndrickxia sp.]